MELKTVKEVSVGTWANSESPKTHGLFMVFYFQHYYPGGGMNDFLGLALSLDQARGMVALKQEGGSGAYQIVDYKTMEIVETKEVGVTH